MKAQAAGLAQVLGVLPPVAKKNQLGSANGVNVGVRMGSAVTICNVRISVRSASATMILFSTEPVYGFSQLNWAISLSRLRVTSASWAGFPVMYTFGASSECTVNGVESPNCVYTMRRRSALISPTRLYVQGVV